MAFFEQCDWDPWIGVPNSDGPDLGFKDRRAKSFTINLLWQFSSLTMSSADWRHSEEPEVRVCVLGFSFSSQCFRVWLDYSDFATHTHTQTPALLRKKLRDREAKPSFNLHQLKRICLPRVHRAKESEAGRQRERGGKGGVPQIFE